MQDCAVYVSVSPYDVQQHTWNDVESTAAVRLLNFHSTSPCLLVARHQMYTVVPYLPSDLTSSNDRQQHFDSKYIRHLRSVMYKDDSDHLQHLFVVVVRQHFYVCFPS